MRVDGLNLGKIAAVTLTLALGTAALAAPASAHDDGWRRPHGGRYVDYRYAPPPRYYYAPPPRVVYVAPPRPAYYYAPPPVVYAPPPPPVISFGFVFGR